MKFYITTPIYYINDIPSVGSAYPTIIADIIARWHRLKSHDVFYLTGLDENSIKTVQAAKKQGFNDIQRYADAMAEKWKNAWKELNIKYDGFIRTTEKRHRDVVVEFFQKVFKKGDIYKGQYSGLYCNGCEAFLTESELVDDMCPHHKTKPEQLSEENYFFRLSKYQNKLMKHIQNNPEFIQPKTRRNEVLSFLKEGLKDVSVSRPGLEWGISLPIDSNHRFWVWFDALLNYISGADKKYWPAELHVIGKDIIRFHCLVWPAMLMSADYPLPKSIFAHGFFTINGQKMSKSLGNAIDPLYIANKYSVDALRYFLIRDIPFGEDGDFSEKALIERINGELVSDLGNLVNRIMTLTEKFRGEINGEPELDKKLDFEKIQKYMDKLELHHAMDEIFNFVRAANKYINEKEPWKLIKEIDGLKQSEQAVKPSKMLGNVLYNLLESLRVISILVSPFMPQTAEGINSQIGIKEKGTFNDLEFKKFSGKPKKGPLLFNKIKI